ncbi:LacI family DNA-binding transcriptional regulator [Actinomyces sp. MRS3W]|uniref:LacI family DNA-binding transcriptional regulator n=1 Tax=Actinomyces sp. MRS3W TaxID=2800796 RepID=UPI0028FDA197|nr:LacI family DNA-binding transcriptional regulator [Actinomyces sp. MRS3W]MDU0348740.1 LacI family DNA-binding transcriptional regulator [Actinomyces sp. MRS3W]
MTEQTEQHERAPQRRRPGMMDVARLAGVSHQTVSRVLNRPESVRPATLARVQAAIDQLGYRRNMAARALVTDSTRMIGVVTTGSHFQGPASTTAAIEVAAREAGYATLVTALEGREEDQAEAEVRDVFDFLIDRGVDGIIAVAPQTWIATSVERAARAVPLVVVADGLPPAERIHVVSVDQELGARMAVGHLLGLGREHVVHLAGPPDWYDALARARGWRSSLEDAGREVPAMIAGDWTAECGYQVGTEMVARGCPDAVFCANDLMALGLLAALRDQGVHVPDDVAVVGFDDTPGTAFFSPPLTTVRQPFDELGVLCMEVLLRAIDGEPGATHSISPTLQVRRSSS